MIPLRDTIPRRTVPFVNTLLIAVNAGAFVLQLLSGPREHEVLLAYAFLPDRLFHPAAYGGPGLGTTLLPILTAMFLHGGFLHIAGNMLYLWIFGDNVEDELGHFRYLLFYLTSGVLAALLQAFTAPSSRVPMIGASGAIAGVLGAYFLFFPRARVVTLVPLFFLFPLVEVPASLYLLFWFLMQFWAGSASFVGRAASGGVAWWAHVGGFVAGLLLAPLFRPARRPAIRYSLR